MALVAVAALAPPGDSPRPEAGEAACPQDVKQPETPPVSIDVSKELQPPDGVTVDLQSDRQPGSYTTSLRWRQNDERATGEIAKVSGRYGTPAKDGNDFPVTGAERLPRAGECGTWLRSLGRQRPQLFEGLDALAVYCFQLWSTDDDGASQSPVPSRMTPPTCTKTPPR